VFASQRCGGTVVSSLSGRNSPLINRIAGRPAKVDELQGARILKNEAYVQYVALTKDEAERSGSRFSPAW